MRTAALALCLIVAASLPSRAQQTSELAEIRAKLAALEAAQQAMAKDVAEIKAILLAITRPAAPPPGPLTDVNVTVAVDGRPSQGRPDAKVVLVEFSDFQCPFCGRYSRETYPQIVKDYVDSGAVKYVFRHFPIEQLHPQAKGAAQAAECAAAQGKFWQVHARLFTNQNALGLPSLPQVVAGLGLNDAAFTPCLNAPLLTAVTADLDAGAKLGITGTPTFFIGTMQPDGTVRATKRVIGAVPFATFKTALDAVLAGAR
jgi:protein-disulfide isomerase